MHSQPARFVIICARNNRILVIPTRDGIVYDIVKRWVAVDCLAPVPVVILLTVHQDDFRQSIFAGRLPIKGRLAVGRGFLTIIDIDRIRRCIRVRRDDAGRIIGITLVTVVMTGVNRFQVGTTRVPAITNHARGLSAQGILVLARTVIPAVKLGHRIEIRAISGLEFLRMRAHPPRAAAAKQHRVRSRTGDAEFTPTHASVAIPTDGVVQGIAVTICRPDRGFGPGAGWG